jgi:hypothetical protein
MWLAFLPYIARFCLIVNINNQYFWCFHKSSIILLSRSNFPLFSSCFNLTNVWIVIVSKFEITKDCVERVRSGGSLNIRSETGSTHTKYFLGGRGLKFEPISGHHKPKNLGQSLVNHPIIFLWFGRQKLKGTENLQDLTVCFSTNPRRLFRL